MAIDKDEVILGSGKLYLVEYTTSIPDDATFETDTNTVGRISGGASLEYKPTEYSVEDDEGEVVKRFITKEEVTMKSGILSFALENMAKLCPGILTDDATKHEKILKIGGAKALTSYALRFVHAKDDNTKLRVTMVATAGNGFSLKFDKAKEMVVDAEFKALSQTDGTLVEIRDGYVAA